MKPAIPFQLQQFKYLLDKGGRKAGCGTDSALIAILLFLPLVGLLGLIAPLMLFIFPLLLGKYVLSGYSPVSSPKPSTGASGEVGRSVYRKTVSNYATSNELIENDWSNAK